MRTIVALTAALLAFGATSGAEANKKKDDTVARQHADLVMDRDCAGVRVIADPLWVVTPLVPFLTTPCNLHEAEKAERALRAFERKHRIKSAD